MMSCRIYLLSLVAIMMFVGLSASYAEEQSSDSAIASPEQNCQVHAVSGGIECIDAAGEQEWEIHHPSLWSDKQEYLAGEVDVFPIEPVTVDHTTFYAVHNDLLEVDVDSGVIENRTPFPLPITKLSPGDMEKLHVTMTKASPTGSVNASDEITLPHTPGSHSPSPRQWSLNEALGQLLTSHDAEWLAASAGDTEQAIGLMEQARRADPTNPFFSQVLGTLFHDSGDLSAAREAFADAADSPDATWKDLLYLSTLLEQSGTPQEADRALQLGLQQIEALGFSPDQLTTMLPLVTTFLGSSEDFSPLLNAFQSGDIEEAQRLAMRLTENFSNLGSSNVDWVAFATWMAAEGPEGLTREWERISAENQDAALTILKDTVTAVDRVVLIAIGLAITLMLLAFLIGIRTGINKLRIRDFIAPAVFFVALLAVPFHLNTHVTVADEFSKISVPNLQDGLASPESQDWIMGLAKDPAVHELISSILAERQALKDGTELPKRTPVVHLLVDTAYADAEQAQFELLKSGQMPDLFAAFKLLDISDFSEFEAPGSMSLAFALIPLAPLAFLFFLGFLFGTLTPGIARSTILVVPGGSRYLAPISAVVLLMLITAVAALAGLDNLVYQAAMPEIHQQFGLPDLNEASQIPTRTWAWLSLAGVAVFHAAMVTWDVYRRTER